MAQYDVYENTDCRTSGAKPYILDVQSDLLQSLTTRVVVPLIPITSIDHPVEILNPVIQVLNKNHYVSSPEIACVHLTTIGRKITRLSKKQSTEIQYALGLLFVYQ